MDFELQTSNVLQLSDFTLEELIALSQRFKLVIIAENKFVIIYNKESLEEHKERLVLEFLGFDTQNEKAKDEWIPEDEEEELDTSTHIQIVTELNTHYEVYRYPEYPEPCSDDIISEQRREYRRNISMGDPY